MYTLQLNDFIEQFPKEHRPEITDLQLFWKNEIYSLFVEFAESILEQYDLRFWVPVWSSVNGWTYRVGKSGVYLITGIKIGQEGFAVDGIVVHDRERAKNYQEKMILIDMLLHEFHQCMISGATGRTVAMNFMDGTHKKIEGIIRELAR